MACIMYALNWLRPQNGRIVDQSILGFFFQAEDGIRDWSVTGVQTCAFFFSSRRRNTRLVSDWSSDVCYSDLAAHDVAARRLGLNQYAISVPVEAQTPGGDIGRCMSSVPGLRVMRVDGTDPLASYQAMRSEERRVGKDGRPRWSPCH